MTRSYTTLANAYQSSLGDILDHGRSVASVRDPLSKASDFGAGDRPYQEVLGHSFTVERSRSCIVDSDAFPVNLAYCFGMLAWSLDGRDDVASLAYYRPGATEFSDDEHTLSGAFGRRLVASRAGDQIAAIAARIEVDPAHRRTFALVLEPEDNFVASREYPCAVGVQLFLRDGALTWLTVMRAQQALTVLPYDCFLFMAMHQVTAARMDVELGPYIHQSGTFHFYDKEIPHVQRLTENPVPALELPPLPRGRDKVDAVVAELIELERALRDAGTAGDIAAIDALVANDRDEEFLEIAQASLGTLAYRRAGHDDALVNPRHCVAPELLAMIKRSR
ncbi:thymidylate synthase [Salinispora arenicola]|uniref:thymidylate synthase n=1 Tax=Salinispora arenicola TaxID=168697 RepID=UPI000373EAFB|nr:thymidylate synthase [Salinispora arenicola]